MLHYFSYFQVKQLVRSTSAATQVRLASLVLGSTSGALKAEEALPMNESTCESEISPTCDLLLQYQRFDKFQLEYYICINYISMYLFIIVNL